MRKMKHKKKVFKIITFLLFVTLIVQELSICNRVEGKGKELVNPFGEPETYIATAYCSCRKCCGEWSEYGITNTGTIPMQGRTVAVDPKIIPLGSTLLVYLDEVLVGIFEAEDTGNLIKGNKIDLYFESHTEALEWGIKRVRVIVVDAKG